MDQDFSTLIFGKPLSQISLLDLQEYFKEAKTESDKLEFKSYPKSLGTGGIAEQEKKVLKTICAFLNSEGGLLIWGTPEGKKLAGTNEKVCEGALTFVSEHYEKDAFISKIANRIIPSPKGVLFHRVEDQGKYIYLIGVPASEYAPHQFDNIYWMRMDGQSVAAPHHYIEALFRKVTFPKLEAYLKIEDYQFENTNKHSRLSCSIIFRNLSRFQNDLNVHCRIIISSGLILDAGSSFFAHNNQSIENGSDHERRQIADVIYYGNYVHYAFDIILNRQHLHHFDYEFKLLLIFGARYSPMKLSNYVIKVGPEFPNKKRWEAIVTKEENVFFHENEQAKGLTDQDVLDRILRS
jgi:Putative DNA-binding domain